MRDERWIGRTVCLEERRGNHMAVFRDPKKHWPALLVAAGGATRGAICCSVLSQISSFLIQNSSFPIRIPSF